MLLPSVQNLAACFGAPFTQMATAQGVSWVSGRELRGECSQQWRCAIGHKWFAVPNTLKLKDGIWCPSCRDAHKMLALQAWARTIDGECLDSVYRGTHGFYLWRCARGHKWRAAPDVARRSWCWACAAAEQAATAATSVSLGVAVERGEVVLSERAVSDLANVGVDTLEGLLACTEAGLTERGFVKRVIKEILFETERQNDAERARAFCHGRP